MKDRLAKFIKIEGLSPSRFAEILGAQPSSISHLLAGRNKPSFDFLARMIQRFPRLSPDWLLLGSGPMYRPTIGMDAPEQVGVRPQQVGTAFTSSPVESRVDPTPPPPAPEYASDEVYNRGAAFEAPNVETETAASIPNAEDPRRSEVSVQRSEAGDPARHAERIAEGARPNSGLQVPNSERRTPNAELNRIILCYGDGTFETLAPTQ